MKHASSRAPGGAAGLWDGLIIDHRYRIVKPLGEGAMGAVFVAEHVGLHKHVALKLVRSEFVGNRELLARFAREALAGSRIEHPSVVSVLDYGALPDGTAYLVMPLVPGTSLKDLLGARGRLPWPQVVELGVQMADALAAAWAHGFVHRDLKPDNILIEPRDHGAPLARIIDFGVAKLLDQRPSGAPAAASGHQPLTKEGTIIGTPGYMAPEQALGRPASHAADLYSLGVVLWEALVGRPRWDGSSVHAILRAQLREQRPSAREAAADPTIPAALDELIERLVSVRAEERPSDALQVRDALRALVQTRTEPAPALPSPRQPGARRAWMVVLGLMAAGAVLGGWFALFAGP